MVFGISSDKSSESHTDEMKELKNQVKLVELDLEKRMILLENSINSIQKAMGTIEKFESSRDAIIELQETKKSLREIEDVGLISKLETISNSDKISAISDTVDEVNEKIKLLSDAMEILGESKSLGKDNPPDNRGNSSINSEIASLKNALSKISSSIADPQKISELDKRIDALETANNSVDAELKKIYDLYREKISFLERRISYASPTSGTRETLPNDIFKMKEEIEQIKNHNKKLAEMIETNSRAFSNIKGIKTEGSGEGNLRSMVADLSIKVAEIKTEMNLEGAGNPKDIMNIKKEMSDIKAVQKSLADVMESIVKTKKGVMESPDYKDKIKNIEKSLNDISGKVSEVHSLNEKIMAISNEINSLKASKNKSIESGTDYKKIVELIGKNPKELNESKDPKAESVEYKKIIPLISDLSAKVMEITTEMNLERAMYPKEIMNIKKEMSDIKAVQKSLADAIGSIEKAKKENNPGAAENKKTDLLGKSLDELAEKINSMQNLKDEINGIENRITLIEKETGSISKNGSRIKETMETEEMLSDMVKSIAEENKSLRQEMEQLKQVCAQIMADNQQQPIIID